MTRGEFVRAVIEQQKQYELMHNAEDELYHYGRKGMKWGENVFENNPITDGIDRMKAEHQKNKLLREAKKRQENVHSVAEYNNRREGELKEQVNKSPNRTIYTGETYINGKPERVMLRNDNEYHDGRLSDHYERDPNGEEIVPPSQRESYDKSKQHHEERRDEEFKEQAQRDLDHVNHYGNKTRELMDSKFGKETTDKVAAKYDSEHGNMHYAEDFARESRGERPKNHAVEDFKQDVDEIKKGTNAARRYRNLADRTFGKETVDNVIERNANEAAGGGAIGYVAGKVAKGANAVDRKMHEMDQNLKERKREKEQDRTKQRRSIFHTAIKDLVDY